MPKYEITGWVEYSFTRTVEASSEEEAQNKIFRMRPSDLAEDDTCPLVDIDDVTIQDHGVCYDCHKKRQYGELDEQDG